MKHRQGMLSGVQSDCYEATRILSVWKYNKNNDFIQQLGTVTSPLHHVVPFWRLSPGSKMHTVFYISLDTGMSLPRRFMLWFECKPLCRGWYRRIHAFCVPKTNEAFTGLERHGVGGKWRFSFWGEVSLLLKQQQIEFLLLVYILNSCARSRVVCFFSDCTYILQLYKFII